MTDRASARAAKDRLRTELAPLDGVGGIGIGRRAGSYVVTVDVLDETHGEQVPTTWDGVDIEVRVVGRVTPLAPEAAETRAAETRATGTRTTGPLRTGPLTTGPLTTGPLTTPRPTGPGATGR